MTLNLYPFGLAMQGTYVGVQDTDPFWKDTGHLLK